MNFLKIFKKSFIFLIKFFGKKNLAESPMKMAKIANF